MCFSSEKHIACQTTAKAVLCGSKVPKLLQSNEEVKKNKMKLS